MMEAIKTQAGISLGLLLDGLIDADKLNEVRDINVSGLIHDSRKVSHGDLFIAYQGRSTHGLLHAVDAVNKGATVVLWDNAFDNSDKIIDEVSRHAVCLYCKDLKTVSGVIADRFYQRPSAELNVIGVTGTDGKTSITHFIAQALDNPGARCGILGTLGNGFIGELDVTGLTTADALNVHQSLAQMRDQGARHAVMEVSSHGLDQGRVNAVAIDIAVFSNFSQDHLDYHETLDEYANAKRKLFSMPGIRAAVINLDDAFGRELAAQYKNRLCVWGYSMQADVSNLQSYADFIVHTRSIDPIESGYHLSVSTPKGAGGVNVRLLGLFNMSNVLATLATLLLSNVSFDEALKRLGHLRPVAGRMEAITVAGKPVVIVDYAHTPQGLESACKAVRDHTDGQVWCVFGCGGDRDRGKRPLMAKMAEKYADRVIVTSDNPRHEDPQAIIDEVFQGFENADKVVSLIDRREAIAYAIANAHAEDIILLAGKGHESSQIIGDVHLAFDDRRVARDCLGVWG